MPEEKPHILICIDWYEPGYKAGGPIRSVAHLVEALHSEYRFSILTSDRDLGDQESYPGIEVDEWIERPHYRIWYASPDRRSYRNIRGIINDQLYDVLYCQSMFSIRFSFLPIWAHRALWTEKPIVLAPRGMLHAGALGFKSRKKRLFLRLLKLVGIHKSVTFQATDAQEVEDIRASFGEDLRIEQVANLPRMALPPAQSIAKTEGELQLIFFSRLTEKKGLHVVLEALQQIDAKVQLDLYGVQDEPAYWERCQNLIQALPAHISVNYRGTVPPAESAGVLQSAHAFVMPTKGENFGHAIFESLAAGRPVLITDQSPWQALTPQYAGWTLPVGDVAAFAQAIQELAGMSQVTWEKWSLGARQVAQDYVNGLDPSEAYGRLFTLPPQTD